MARLVATRQIRSLAAPAWVNPVANADSVAGGVVNQAMTIQAATVLANDTVDPRGSLAVQSVQNPIGCTVSLNSPAQAITVMPVQVSPVSFQYTLIDTQAHTASATVTLPSVTAAPPPAGLPQKVIGPPQLSNPTTLLISAPGIYTLNSGTDYRVQFISTPIPGKVTLIGGNKVHVGWGPTVSDYGGEITESGDGVSCLIVQDMQSECWIEGMVCRKNGTHGHCFQIRCVTTQFPVYILNCFADGALPNNTGGGGSTLSVHDGICPKITVDGFTDITYGTGIANFGSGGAGSYSQLVCNRVYAHWGTNASRLIGTLYEVPATASFTDCWAIDDTNPTASIQSFVSGVTIGAQTFSSLGLRGVQAQFDEGWDPAILDSANTTDIDPAFVRFNFLRPHTENKTGGVFNGTYDFTVYAPALTKMKALGQKHTMTLFYGSDVWDGDFSGFANWAVAAALYEITNFSGVLVALEIWNEPDGTWPVSATNYVTMAATIKASVRAQPALNNILIIGAATFNATDLTYWNTLLAGGILGSLDQISFHGYGPPELLISQLPGLQSAIADNSKQFYISEWGGYTSANVNKETARRLSVMKFLGIAGATYFPLRDYASAPDGGLLTSTGTIKPQGSAWLEWHTNIGDSATYVGQDTLNAVSYSFIFNKAGTTVRHLWAVNNTRVLINGGATTLTPTPIYVTGSATVVLDPAGDQILADLSRNFSTGGQDQPFHFLSRNNDDTGETDMSVAASDTWSITGNTSCRTASNFAGFIIMDPNGASKAVMRWVVPAGVSRIKIVGTAQRAQFGGDGTLARVLRNVTTLFAQTLTTTTGAAFNRVINVTPGDKIDFESGSGGTDASFDEMFFINTIVYSTTDPVN